MKQAGIYRIVVARPDGNRFYIGQAVNMAERGARHLARLRLGSHKNPKLQAALSKYGEAAFSFEPILICPRETPILRMYEQAILDFYIQSFGAAAVYNVHRNCVSSRLGIPVSEETRAKMRATALAAGRKPSAFCIEQSRKKNIGRKMTPEQIAIRTSKQSGVKRSQAHRDALSAANAGKIVSDETRARISASKKGKPASARMLAHIARLATLNAGKPLSDATKAAISARKRGRTKPAEEIARRQATRAANSQLANGGI